MLDIMLTDTGDPKDVARLMTDTPFGTSDHNSSNVDFLIGTVQEHVRDTLLKHTHGRKQITV